MVVAEAELALQVVVEVDVFVGLRLLVEVLLGLTSLFAWLQYEWLSK